MDAYIESVTQTIVHTAHIHYLASQIFACIPTYKVLPVGDLALKQALLPVRLVVPPYREVELLEVLWLNFQYFHNFYRTLKRKITNA